MSIADRIASREQNNPVSSTEELLGGKKKKEKRQSNLNSPAKAGTKTPFNTSEVENVSNASADGVIPNTVVNTDNTRVDVNSKEDNKIDVNLESNTNKNVNAKQSGEKKDNSKQKEESFVEDENVIDDEYAQKFKALKGIWNPDATEVVNENKEAKTPQIGRYNWNLQHGWVIPSMSKDWLTIAQEENKIPTGLSRSHALNGAISASAKQRELNRISSNWDKFQAAIKGGYYSNADGTLNLKDVYEEAYKLKNSYARAGGDPDNLYDLGGNIGGFAAKKSSATQKDLRIINRTQVELDKLIQQLKDGSFADARNKSYWDKVADLVAKDLSESGAAISDEEKIRNQYLTQPGLAMKKYHEVVDAYQKVLTSYERAGVSKEFIQNMRGRLAMADKTVTSNNPQSAIEGLVSVVKIGKEAISGGSDSMLASSLSAAGDNAKRAFDVFQQQMIREAKVDPKILYALLTGLRDKSIEKYNGSVQSLGGLQTSFKKYSQYNNDADNWYINHPEDKGYEGITPEFAGASVFVEKPRVGGGGRTNDGAGVVGMESGKSKRRRF